MDGAAINAFEEGLSEKFRQLAELQTEIRQMMVSYADDKLLKGNELVGWLGEIYGKLLFRGTLIEDRFDHDFETIDGWRVSVKARMGTSWRQSGIIPKINGDDSPTHLLFLRLTDSFLLHTAWLHDWQRLRNEGRFRSRTVRGVPRAYVFIVSEARDKAAIVYSREALALGVPPL